MTDHNENTASAGAQGEPSETSGERAEAAPAERNEQPGGGEKTSGMPEEEEKAVSPDRQELPGDGDKPSGTSGEKDELTAEGILEGMLFASGTSVSIAALAEAMEMPEAEIRRALKNLQEKYGEKDRGIRLAFFDGRVQLCTKPETYGRLIRLTSRPHRPVLTQPMLETLSIIAYRQPVTRMEIDQIRGVKSDHAVSRLLDYNLIEEAGRLDTPGRPIVFATTEEFLRSFGISSLAELPAVPEAEKEQFREEAEKEVPVDV
jgi:segregation and condensation protein B